MQCCQNPRCHITDSHFYSRGYTTPEAREVFCDFRRLQRWLDVESALAASQAEMGMIPVEDAVKLADTARLDLLNLEEIRSGIAETGHSLIPLLNEWQRVAGPDAARFVHFGATTQDIQDTAQSLEIRDVLSIVNRDLELIITRLKELAGKYRDQVMIGRTHGQHALPTTLGLKIAVWLDEMLRHGQRIKECGNRILVSQLFGGVGTMAAFGSREVELLETFSTKLGLQAPFTAWHSARDRVAEFISTLGLLTGTMAKIANEICQLAKDETSEMEEPFHMGKIGSTTMPHKRNPELCEQVVVLAKLVKSCAGLAMDGLINEHERDYRAVRTEWVGVTDASLYTCGALDLLKNILNGLIVHPGHIQRNLDISACLISTEALMFLIGNEIGKPAAHQLLYEISMQARTSGIPLTDLLNEHPQIKGRFSPESIREAVDPARNTGAAGHLTDRVVKKAEIWLEQKQNSASGHLPCPLAKTMHCGQSA